MAGEIIRADAVAALLGLTVRTVHTLAKRGKLPGRRVGKHWYFARDVILALVSTSVLARVKGGGENRWD